MSPGYALLHPLARPQGFSGPKVVKRSAYRSVAVPVIRRPDGPSTYLPQRGISDCPDSTPRRALVHV